MASILGRRAKSRGVEVKACCGEVCDDRCWERSVREREFRRRVTSAGVLRVV